MDTRHPSTLQLLRWFSFKHLPSNATRDISHACRNLAEEMIANLNDGPELTTGLRKLLEAKDCFVRQAIADQDVE
jgi:hypothetical protein